MSEDLDRLTEMLKLIQKGEQVKTTKDDPASTSDNNLFNTGLSAKEIDKQARNAEEKAREDPSFEFTERVFKQALVDLLPYIISSNKDSSPFDEVMVKMLHMNRLALRKHYAELIAQAIKAMPDNAAKAIMEDVKSAQILLTMVSYAVTEMVFIASAAARLHEEEANQK